MTGFFEFIDQGWVGTLTGIIGIITGFIFYKISKRTPRPCFQKSSLRLIGHDQNNLPRDVAVTYRGSSVERLTRTTLVIWNEGNKTLDGSQIVEKDPLTIRFNKDDKILSFEILKMNKEANSFGVSFDANFPNKLVFSFDYLDSKDGAVIELLHDSERKYPTISGSIKGVGKGFFDKGIFANSDRERVKLTFWQKFSKEYLGYAFIVLAGLLIASLGLFPIEYLVSLDVFLSDYRSYFVLENSPLTFMVIGLCYASIPFFVLWPRRRKYPKQLEFFGNGLGDKE